MAFASRLIPLVANLNDRRIPQDYTGESIAFTLAMYVHQSKWQQILAGLLVVLDGWLEVMFCQKQFVDLSLPIHIGLRD